MNAAKLYKDELYAWKANRPKGTTPIDAKKVRIRYVEQHKRSDYSNRTTHAMVVVVDSGEEKLIRARDIIDFWENYEVEQEMMLKERRERDKEARRHRLKPEITQTMVNYKLNERGIPLTLSINYSGSSFNVSDSQVLDWLGITREDIQEAVERAIGREFDGEE